MKEIWDAYDINFHKIDGVTLIKGEEIKEGLFHLVSDILVQHIDGTYLLMKRDASKKHGDIFEATAGGSAKCGETALECAYRELLEETGIKADNLKEVGRSIAIETHSIYIEFLCITDVKKDDIKVQIGETSSYKWVTLEELIYCRDHGLISLRMCDYISTLKC